MSFDPSRLVSQLSALDKEEGDIRLRCQGEVVKAHLLILSMRYSIMQEIGMLEITCMHCSHMGPHLRDPVPMGTFFSFWVPIFVPRSPFSLFKA